MRDDEPDPDRDLWGRGSRRWRRIAWHLVRPSRGNFNGRKAHAMMWRRFADHWPTLEAETFGPLIARARERDADRWAGHGLADWRHGFLASVCAAAHWWGIDATAAPDRTAELRAAVDELRGINHELRDLAGRMADLFERGGELRDRFALEAEWTAPGPDLWGLLEEVAERPMYRSTCLDPGAGLEPMLRYMRGTTRPTPVLADLLGVLAMCEPGEPAALDAADAEALAKSQGAQPGAWPERVRLLFATLADPAHRWRDRRGHAVTMLDCFTAPALAHLASVAAGFGPAEGDGPPALGTEAIEKALRRFRGGRTRPSSPG